MSPPSATPPPRRAALIFIFVTVLLDMLALGVIIPVLPGMVTRFVGGDHARAVEMTGLFGTAWALMHFLCSPILGGLSDRFGRRPVVLLSNLGLGLDYVLMALAPSLWWLFVGRVISGITSASFGTASAYIADVTPPEKRSGAFGMLGAAFGVGFVLGPALGGIAGKEDPRLAFWISAGLSLINFGYGMFVLPESLPPERRSRFSWRKANPVGALMLLRSRPGLIGLAGINFLRLLAHLAFPATFVLYGSHRYGWDERTIGLVMAGVGISSMVVQAGLVRPAVKRFGERKLLIGGLLCGVAGCWVQGLAPNGRILLFLGVPLTALWGLGTASLQGMLSRQVGPSEQGQLQGANSSLTGIAELIGPGLFSMTFALAIGRYQSWNLPGAAFLLAGVLLLFATALAWWVTRTMPGAAIAAAPPPQSVVAEGASTSS